jgi:hypothetical protein
MAKIRVYVAGPYTKGNPEVNTDIAIQIGDWLLESGFYPYIPHFSHFWNQRFPHHYDVWMDLDKVWLLQCNALLRISGESTGADQEEQDARDNGIPVFYTIQALKKHFLTTQVE